MFGYITINKPELKVKEYDYYQSCYCGLCYRLKQEHGIIAPALLTYDMTFLSMLLTSLYETGYHGTNGHCLLNPFKKRVRRENDMTGYAADMTILLSYHNLMDDWHDDKNIGKLALAQAIRREYKKVRDKYPRQERAVSEYMIKLTACEQAGDDRLDLAAGYTGEMLREIFCYRLDEWREPLGQIGFYLGKFIYLMDAYDDVEEDIRDGNYNPLISIYQDDDFEKRAAEILNMMAMEAARAFERLPILANAEILRNIIYSGIWVPFTKTQQKRAEKSAKEQVNSDDV